VVFGVFGALFMWSRTERDRHVEAFNRSTRPKNT